MVEPKGFFLSIHTISYELISKSDWIQANIDGYNCDYRALESIFNKCVSD